MGLLEFLINLCFAPFDWLARLGDSEEKVYQRTYRSAPTAGPGDDGGGWQYWNDEEDGNWGYEREVRWNPPEGEEDKWSLDHGTGRYHYIGENEEENWGYEE